MITFASVIKRLTDVFAKSPDSNIGKLIGIMTEQLQELEQTFERVRAWRDIDQAEGTTLDRIGSNVGQPRGVATDQVYRILIKSKIARNLSTGDINTIIRVLSTALDCEPNEVRITELYNDPLEPEPAALSLIQVPLSKINEIGMSPYQFGRIVQRTVAAGVRVSVIELTGTFAFGDDTVTDNEAGFADLDGTVGGYLGAAYSPENDPDLPI